ncbi:hypothetical protein NDU88_001006 [Pleurodeles waltl]|uniref:Uncharacterized protein n=1 Tax=Pleurodeles waltl TaxID=8319 RepID=A0AAV7LEN4_PLEWA|nr:hypothetical protein NDU88_001006 [Pleurodeles waltl]
MLRPRNSRVGLTPIKMLQEKKLKGTGHSQAGKISMLSKQLTVRSRRAATAKQKARESTAAKPGLSHKTNPSVKMPNACYSQSSPGRV